jgi:hypothetical protein
MYVAGMATFAIILAGVRPASTRRRWNIAKKTQKNIGRERKNSNRKGFLAVQIYP